MTRLFRIQSKSGYFETGFFCPIVFFCRQVSVEIVLFVIQLENNRIYLSSFFKILSGDFIPLFFFLVKSHVKIVLFVIQLENYRIYLSSGFFVYRVTLSFWQCNQMDKITRFRLYSYGFIFTRNGFNESRSNLFSFCLSKLFKLTSL